MSWAKKTGPAKATYTRPKQPAHPKPVLDKRTYTTPFIGLEKIISGGQTGADRAGLDAAKVLQIKTGGTAPENYLTEDGPDPSLKQFGLVAVSGMTYKRRSQVNVEDSDATIAIRLQPGNGTDKTIGYCHSKVWSYGEHRAQTKEGPDVYRPVFVVTSLAEEQQETIEALRQFVTRNQIRVVNIAGHRETTSGIENFAAKSQAFLIAALGPVVAKPN